MIDAINRATPKSKLANSDIGFKDYGEYERMQARRVECCSEERKSLRS